MTRRPPSIITEFIVMIIAIGLVAGGLEAYLRVTATQKSKLYEGIETVPEIADTYFQHVFLEKHATKDAWNNANYDPQLGWDYQIAASRIRGPRKTGPKPAGMFRVIALGDSFTWGIEVGEDDHFPHYLEKILQGQRAAEVFNMGVGSYGIDQMLLKYLSVTAGRCGPTSSSWGSIPTITTGHGFPSTPTASRSSGAMGKPGSTSSRMCPCRRRRRSMRP